MNSSIIHFAETLSMAAGEVASIETFERNQALDKVVIADLIQRERAARDGARWEEMATYHHPESMIDVAWFKGPGADFVRATEKNWRTDAINFHEMGPATVAVNKDRAIAETACTLHGFYTLTGVDVTSTGFVRLLWRAQLLDGRWLIAGLRSLYIRDLLQPCSPSGDLDLDEKELSTYRQSYRFLTYTLKALGRDPKHDLPGLDRPESVTALLSAEQTWLNEA